MRLIDADELKAVYIPSDIEGFETMMVPAEVVIQNIDDMPTVDAVPVRCADCIRYLQTDEVWGRCTVMPYRMRKKDYCSYGVRKDGGDEQTKKPE